MYNNELWVFCLFVCFGREGNKELAFLREKDTQSYRVQSKNMYVTGRR